jgi:hypothetical protein
MFTHPLFFRSLALTFLAFAPVRAFNILGNPGPDTTLPLAAVVGFKSYQGDAAGLEDLSDRLFREAYRTGKWRLVERERADAILREQAFQQTNACSTSCETSIGRILGANTLLIPSFERYDEVSHLAIREVDASSGEVLRMAEAETDEPLSSGGRKLASLAIRRLVGDGSVPASDSGTISVTTWPPSPVWIDGERAGTSPLTVSVWPGTHRVSVTQCMRAPPAVQEDPPPSPDFAVAALIDLRTGAFDHRARHDHRRPHRERNGYRNSAPVQRDWSGEPSRTSESKSESHESKNTKKGDDNDGATAAVVAGVVVAAVGVGLLAAAASEPDSLWDRTSQEVRVKAGDTAKVVFQKSPNGNKTALNVIGVIGLMLAITLIAIGVSSRH